MVHNAFQYALSLYRDDGSFLGETPVVPDFVPARERAGFDGMRRGLLPPTPATLNYVVQPTWHPTAGQPFLSGFTLAVSNDGDEKSLVQFPSRYFEGLAQDVAARHIQEGRLKAGELFRYLVAAFPAKATSSAKPAPAFLVATADPPLALGDGADLAGFRDASVPFDGPREEDVSVFIPRAVLDEAVDVTRRAGRNESGGLLIGRLHRDSRTPEIFVQITAQVAAEHALGQAAKLTFTSATWTAARAAIALRRSNEQMLGWYHSHPFAPSAGCKDCEKHKNRTCSASSAFFSGDDIAVHRAIFPRAYSVALVIGESDCAGLVYALFGWGKQGSIVQRGFHILEGAVPRADASAAKQSGGNENGKQ
jgi:proteasome lid subunit RPN8/RPN11